MKQHYKKYNWHSNKNTDGLVNRLASNLVILNQAHRVAWLIWQAWLIRYGTQKEISEGILPLSIDNLSICLQRIVVCYMWWFVGNCGFHCFASGTWMSCQTVWRFDPKKRHGQYGAQATCIIGSSRTIEFARHLLSRNFIFYQVLTLTSATRLSKTHISNQSINAAKIAQQLHCNRAYDWLVFSCIQYTNE